MRLDTTPSPCTDFMAVSFSIDSCMSICMLLSSLRMASVMWRRRWARYLALRATKGVSSSRLHANQASMDSISMKAPNSCTPVTTMRGSTSVVMADTVAMSRSRRWLMSPEWRRSVVEYS